MLMEYAIYGRKALSGRLFAFGVYDADADESIGLLFDTLVETHGAENIGVSARPCSPDCETGK